MIYINELSKEYDQGKKALDHLNLQLNMGTVVGFAGPNGAGKTTTLRILATLIKPSSGTVQICGHDIKETPNIIRSLVGYLPEKFGFYEKFSGFWNLNFYCNLFNRQFSIDENYQVIKALSLFEHLKTPVGKYSNGMKQKLGIIRLLAIDPKIILLDEPLNGMDIESQIELLNILQSKKNQNILILISSHFLPAIESICDRLIIINNGKIISDLQMSDWRKETIEKHNQLTINDLYLEIIRRSKDEIS